MVRNVFTPKFTITNQILKNIGAIEAAKEVIENAPLVPMEKRFKTTHYFGSITGRISRGMI
jgi:hypothetical protein